MAVKVIFPRLVATGDNHEIDKEWNSLIRSLIKPTPVVGAELRSL